MDWTFFDKWNQSLEAGRPERPLLPRNHIWATELGGSFIDRYLKMNGTAQSNPPNPRSLRKFEAGNIWESIIKFVLLRAGILQNSQKWVEFKYPDSLQVTGKLDFIAGGKPDYSLSAEIMEKEFAWLPEFISRATLNIVDKLKEIKTELKPIILEVKSCSSFMFDNYEKCGIPDPKHSLQLFHYLKAENLDEGHIVYVCKDDARLLEMEIKNPSDLEQQYYRDIELMTEYMKSTERPPLEKPITWKENFGKFAANWKVSYSNYLKMLYGFENQFAFENTYKPIVSAWNRVISRLKKGDKMTDSNKKYLDDIQKAGFNVEELKSQICEDEENEKEVET